MRQVHPNAFTSDELSALKTAAPCCWWQGFIELSATTGLRVQECLRLHWTDVCERTHSVRVTSDPVDSFGDTEYVTLRRWLPHHQERVVELPLAVVQTLSRLRSEQPNDSHVFVPDWKLHQLWARIVSRSPVTTDHLCPGLAYCFRMIQRRARLALARSRQHRLAEVEWRERPVASLRTTAAVRLAEQLGPRELAARLGCGPNASVIRLLSHSPTAQGAA